MNRIMAMINAIALVNALDTIERLYGESDEEITKRYGDEAGGLKVAERYLEIAERAERISFGPLPISMKVTQPDADGNRSERICVFESEEYENPDILKETSKHRDVNKSNMQNAEYRLR